MARIRTIKPEFWSSPDTASVEDPWARLLFVAMWNWADDMGRGTANPKELAGFAFPNDEWISSADIRRMLGEIRRGFDVTFYRVGGRTYYAIPSWDTHQKIDKRSGGKHPAPEEGELWEPDPTQPPDQHKRNGSKYPPESSAEPAESTPIPRRVLGAGTGEQGNRGTRTTTSATAVAAPKTEPSADGKFDEFWALYPRKVDKVDARAAWKTVLKRKVDPDHVIAALHRQLAAWRAEGKEVKFIPHPPVWLRKGRYDDEVEPTRLTLVPASAPLPVDPTAALADLRSRAAAKEAADLIGVTWVEPPQPPSNGLTAQQWSNARRVEFIDAHAGELRAALTERKTG